MASNLFVCLSVLVSCLFLVYYGCVTAIHCPLSSTSNKQTHTQKTVQSLKKRHSTCAVFPPQILKFYFVDQTSNILKTLYPLMCVLTEISAETPSCLHRTSLLCQCVWPCCCRARGGGWWAKEWLGMAVKSPSDNELSSADWSSHTFTQTSSSRATDLLFTLMPYNVFIHKNCVNSHQGLTINILRQNIQDNVWCSLWTSLCYFTVLHTYIHRVVLRVKTLTFRPFWSKVSTNQESKSEQKGQWTPLTVHYSALTLLVCVCVSRLRAFPLAP